MPAKKIKQDINLLPEVDFEYSTKGRIITWLLGSFRIIVIITELIVVSAFFLRFGLDSRTSDLSDEIEEKQALIASYSVTESRIKNYQAKADIYGKHSLPSKSFALFLNDIKRSVSPTIILTELNLYSDRISLSGKSSDEVSIQKLISNLNTLDYISGAKIAELGQNKENKSLSFFTVTATIK